MEQRLDATAQSFCVVQKKETIFKEKLYASQ
jgi:hypothetical protein